MRPPLPGAAGGLRVRRLNTAYLSLDGLRHPPIHTSQTAPVGLRRRCHHRLHDVLGALREGPRPPPQPRPPG
eukprot:3530237-Lingulodinium_polyedra.AAC.1